MSLSGLSRADRLLGSIVLVAAALVALVAWLVMPPDKTGDRERQPSTFFNAAYGTKAAYLVLDGLEYPVTRLRRPIGRETLGGIGVLFVLAPAEGLGEHEMDALKDWVRQGHALVVVPGWSSAGPGQNRRPLMTRGSAFGDWFDVVGNSRDRDREPGDSPAPGQSSPAQPDPGIELNAGEPICAGIRHLTNDGDARFAPSPLRGPLAGAVPEVFWRDRQGPMGLRVSFGDGVIVALANAYPLSNRGLGQLDNGLLLGNIARELSRFSPGKIAFDEYHLGFPERDYSSVAMVKLMLAGPWRWAVAQAVLVLALALSGGGPLRPPARRNPHAAPPAPRVRRGGRPAVGGVGRCVAGRRDALSLLPRPALPRAGARAGRGRRAAARGGPRAFRPRGRRRVERGPGRRRAAGPASTTSGPGPQTSSRCGGTRSWTLKP